jgi:hypothetical protein
MADRYEEIAREIVLRHVRIDHTIFAPENLRDAIATALREQETWWPIDDPEHPAPRDGTPILVRLKDPIPNARDDLRRWDGASFVARNRDDLWCFAAPVGQGGFPDEWIAGWRSLPPPPQSVRQDG